MESFESHFIE